LRNAEEGGQARVAEGMREGKSYLLMKSCFMI